MLKNSQILIILAIISSCHSFVFDSDTTVSCSWACYLARYADLQVAFGCDIGAAEQHWNEYGSNEGRDCSYDSEAACNWKCYGCNLAETNVPYNCICNPSPQEPGSITICIDQSHSDSETTTDTIEARIWYHNPSPTDSDRLESSNWVNLGASFDESAKNTGDGCIGFDVFSNYKDQEWKFMDFSICSNDGLGIDKIGWSDRSGGGLVNAFKWSSTNNYCGEEMINTVCTGGTYIPSGFGTASWGGSNVPEKCYEISDRVWLDGHFKEGTDCNTLSIGLDRYTPLIYETPNWISGQSCTLYGDVVDIEPKQYPYYLMILITLLLFVNIVYCVWIRSNRKQNYVVKYMDSDTDNA